MGAILVTGATGTIGSEVVKALAARSADVRVAVRNAEKTNSANAVRFEWDDPASIRAALTGVERAFLLTPFSEKQADYGKAFVRAAKEAKVTHLVKLSVIGADAEPGITLGKWHREVEKAIEASGIPFTLLRPTNFMNNFVSYYPPDEDGNLYLPWGDAKISFIDARDVGAVAACVLTEPGHAGKIYTPTGPAAFTGNEIASELSRAWSRPIRYVDVPESAAKQGMAQAGVPGWMNDAMLELHAICKAGWVGTVTNDVKLVTGGEPRTLAQFAKDNAHGRS
jgi:uncharacterized protein YbjT (DUF2867 family)